MASMKMLTDSANLLKSAGAVMTNFTLTRELPCGWVKESAGVGNFMQISSYKFSSFERSLLMVTCSC
jgi:hypothetical protein